MKSKLIITFFSVISITLFFSCEEDSLITNDQELSVRAKGGVPGPPNGGGGDDGSAQHWKVEYTGSIIYSTTAYGRVDVNNPKYELMQTDACGKYTFNGITTLDLCSAGFDFCIDGTGIRQFDLKKDPGHVANHLWILHPDGNLNLKMFGWLAPGEKTVFPPLDSTVTVNFERWELNAPNCNEVIGTFLPGEASVTITGLGLIDCQSTPDMGDNTCSP